MEKPQLFTMNRSIEGVQGYKSTRECQLQLIIEEW